MKLDYKEIGRRIAHRRKQLGLKQATVEEMGRYWGEISLLYRTGYLHSLHRGPHASGHRAGHHTR